MGANVWSDVRACMSQELHIPACMRTHADGVQEEAEGEAASFDSQESRDEGQPVLALPSHCSASSGWQEHIMEWSMMHGSLFAGLG